MRISWWTAVLALVSLLVSACTADGGEPPPAGGSAPDDPAAGFVEVVERAGPSVVTVLADGGGLGSGVVLRPDVVVSNAHVVGREREVTIVYADGVRSPATVLATDTVTDLAVMRTERTNLPVPPFRAELPRQGERALAIGSPLGFQNSVTAGIISGLHREVPGSAAQTRSLVDLIQTDAPISPGNSGGALLDAQGQVIGINEAYIPPTAGAVSLGFAIPTATVLDVTDQLLADGTATHPYLGVSVAPLTPAIQRQLDVGTDHGAVVIDVDQGGPAAAARLRPGDVIVELAGHQVRSVEDLLTALRRTEPGQEHALVFVRDDQRQQVSVTVGSRTAG